MVGNKYLFYDFQTFGHHAEYLYHLISYRIENPSLPEFTFVVNPQIITTLDEFDLPNDLKQKGVNLINPTLKEIYWLNKVSSVFKKAEIEFDIINRIAIEKQINRCYLMYINRFQFVIGRKNSNNLPFNIRGILFNPMVRKKHYNNYLGSRIRKYLQLKWILRNRKVEHIYILNDKELVSDLNRIYRKKCIFKYLPDPILCLEKKNLIINKKDKTGRTIFLIFGALSARKGIFTVIESIKNLPYSIIRNVEFFFAGKIVDDDRDTFIDAINKIRLERKVIINYIDDFVSYKRISEIFYKSDWILLAYDKNNLSSGILGHAALYRKPVIGPAYGIIGKLIKDYNLGICIEQMNSKNLAANIEKIVINKIKSYSTSGMKRYVEERNSINFVKILID